LTAFFTDAAERRLLRSVTDLVFLPASHASAVLLPATSRLLLCLAMLFSHCIGQRRNADKRFRKIASDVFEINAGSAVVDGEVVVPSADGTTDFSVLQNELKGRSTKIVLVAFDLLYLDGYDLRKLPLFERKERLRKLIAGSDIQFSESFEIDGREMFQHACKTGLEGSCRRCGKAAARPVGPMTGQGDVRPAGDPDDCWLRARRQRWDGLYMGRRTGKDLVYAGKVDHGFDVESAKMLRARLTPLVRKTQPSTKRIAHWDVWVEPELLAEIEYRAKSAEGKLRHPFYGGLREDL
jgi:bifunctional non-homologous end joining protein LigD